jgi:fumigallin biosynthesis monooxygenase-like protein
VKPEVKRHTVDLSGYPDLVVIYLGMRANALAGIKTLIGFGPKISKSADERPDGLLLHESLLYSLFPPHVGMRQYWRDFESLEKWTRSEPHRIWWKKFLRDTGGTGFWHEAYFVRGGMEAIYIDINMPVGFSAFAPVAPARGAMFSARRRMDMSGEPASVAPLSEAELYSSVEER